MVVKITCAVCKAEGIPTGGQCPKCGFVDGFARLPSDEEFRKARQINKDNKVDLFRNIDMVLVDVAGELFAKKK